MKAKPREAFHPEASFFAPAPVGFAVALSVAFLVELPLKLVFDAVPVVVPVALAEVAPFVLLGDALPAPVLLGVEPPLPV